MRPAIASDLSRPSFWIKPRRSIAKIVPPSPDVLPFCNMTRSLVAGNQPVRHALGDVALRYFTPFVRARSTFSIAVGNFPRCDRAGHALCPLAYSSNLGLGL